MPDPAQPQSDSGAEPGGWAAYKLRWKRRRALWRSFRSRHALRTVQDRTGAIRPDDILCVMVVRNEALRVPFFLDWHRRLGVSQFLVVDNASSDGTAELLAAAPDVSLWSTSRDYRDARFGLDWASWLLMRYGHGHWCLLLDADELLVYAHHETRPLSDLTRWLETRGRVAFGALMLELYGRAPLGTPVPDAANAPLKDLCWFDAGPYRVRRQDPMQNLWVQGGMRERMFFADRPDHSPTLNKLPLIRWDRRWAFVNSAHAALPVALNHAYSGPGGPEPSGVLLHTKFLPDVVARAQEDLDRQQHFHDPQAFSGYYHNVLGQPVPWHEGSRRYKAWRDLETLGLMNSGGWT